MLVVSNSQCSSTGLQRKVLALSLALKAKSLALALAALKAKSLALALALKVKSLLTSLCIVVLTVMCLRVRRSSAACLNLVMNRADL